MRILIINVRIGTGSVGRIVSDLYHGIVDSGHECKIAFARGEIGDLPLEDTYKICSDFEIKMHAGLTRLFGNTAFYFENSTRRFCEWIDKYSPDIVHIHGVYGYYLNMKVLFNYLSEKNIQVISTLHSCWDFTGHCCYFDYINCARWKSGCKLCPQKSAYPKSSFLDNTEKNYIRKQKLYESIKNCTIITPSRWLANYVKESFLCNKNTQVINNGIDLESFKKTTETYEGLDMNRPIILCVANIWEKRKGWDDVVNLSNLVGDKYQLVVVGVNNAQVQELNKHTMTISRTSSKEELAKLYSTATVFFNPTYEDNYPTVNLEAAACNLPIVTYNTGGSPEVFQYGNWGIVISPKDFNRLLDYSVKVFKKEIVFDYSNRKMLSKDNMVKKYIELYQEINKT